MEQDVYDLFNKLEISYEVITHPAIFKAADREFIDIDFKDSVCCKNLLLKDEKNGDLFLVSLEIDKRANLKNIASVLGTNRLTFAKEDELIENLGVKSGSASVLNIIAKPNTCVKFVVDKNLLKLEKIAFHPNVNTASISFSPLRLEEILKYYNANYIFIDV